jgi:outer membrane protein TolC
MSLPPGTAFQLADTAEVPLPQALADVDALERLALERRPEVMEEWYRRRVTENDIKAAKILLWPNLSIDAGAEYDSNRFLYHHQWVDTGVKVSWNLFRLFQLPALEQAQKDQVRTDDLRRVALSMAVLTQVRVGAQRYQLARSELAFADESLQVDERLLEYARAAAKSQFDSELEVIRAEARALLSRYQRQASYANAQAAWGRLYNSVGLDVLPDALQATDVDTVARAIDATMAGWSSAVPGIPAPADAPAPSRP